MLSLLVDDYYYDNLKVVEAVFKIKGYINLISMSRFTSSRTDRTLSYMYVDQLGAKHILSTTTPRGHHSLFTTP